MSTVEYVLAKLRRLVAALEKLPADAVIDMYSVSSDYETAKLLLDHRSFDWSVFANGSLLGSRKLGSDKKIPEYYDNIREMAEETDDKDCITDVNLVIVPRDESLR
jgi:hypothetical protein